MPNSYVRKGVNDINRNKSLPSSLKKSSTSDVSLSDYNDVTRQDKINKSSYPPETKVVFGEEVVLTETKNLIEKTEAEVSICSPISGLELVNNTKQLLESFENLISRHKEDKVKYGVRWIVNIENNGEQIVLIKKFLRMGFCIRHIDNLPILSFAVSERQFNGTIENMKGDQLIHTLLYSTDPLYIKHFQSVFDNLWNSALDAKERIRQIERGVTLDFTKLIENSRHAKPLLIETVQKASKEILILFPSLNAVKREVVMGFMEILKQKSVENIQIKILSPVNKMVKEVIYKDDTNKQDLMVKNILCREIRNQKDLISTIMIVDRKYVLATELKDDSKLSFEEAVGLTTFSTSQPTVLSYLSIFESLWIQTEMSEDLKRVNEKLVQSEELERDFINTAAHELRTPTQAITGYLELNNEIFENYSLSINQKQMTLEESFNVIKDLKKHQDIISRNAMRLENLINNLLDVARIDSHQKNMIMLNKENINLIAEINSIVDTQLGEKLRNKNVKVTIINDLFGETYFVYADRSRLNQILINLLENAIKFSEKDSTIDILIYEDIDDVIKRRNVRAFEKTKDNKIKSANIEKKDNIKEIFVAVSDSGKGISPEILPRLFEKFNSNSAAGTGLGLYISKKLIEAMEGRIWAFNNADGKGSTFVFSLPKFDSSKL
ncbi:sensor histidine kinase [Candidatus Nitrosocosmicus sp. FF01]|uniref:sensor histidine kinase n=1 Tax=Candidatus Nitrosocosmicus sp. FF01 TaxID=3397670 RepID=UPI0039ECC507